MKVNKYKDYISIIIPCRNEVDFIGQCLGSILANDYPPEKYEVLVVDGMSEDGTREIITDFTRRHTCIKLIDNIKRVTPVALNTGIKHARGEIIMRIDAHARLKKDYILQCVNAIQTYKADNVGGIMITLPQKPSSLGRAIALSLSHRFGVGNSYFRVHIKEPRRVDTVFGGCYRREVFQKIGLFNEHLRSSQDIEFNLRLKKGGRTTLLVPDIVCYYYTRSTFWSFCQNNVRNGIWAIMPFIYSEVMPVSVRHLVPLAFTVALLSSASLAFIAPIGGWIFAGIAGSYSLVNLTATLQIVFRERTFQYLFIIPVMFLCLHLCYGIGSLYGAAKVIRLIALRQR